MGDGSGLRYCIEITLQTEQEFSIAYRKIKDLKNITLTEIIERELVHLLNDCPDDDGDDDGDPEDKEQEIIDFYKSGGHKQEVGDLLTADDYPESAE